MYGNINLKELHIEAPIYISKEELLSKISEYQIFTFYFGKDFSLGKAYCSPLRKDDNPSFVVNIRNGRLSWIDFGTNSKGDVFDFVSKLFGLTFKQSVLKIAFDFNLEQVKNIKSPFECIRTAGYITNKKPFIHEAKGAIRIKVRKWSKTDAEYWLPYNINSELLNLYKVFPVEKAYLDDIIIYNNNTSCPCYAYMFYKDNKYTYKLYRPFNKNKKWKGNIDRSVLQGWSQLDPFAEILIITKSLKDVMVLRSLGINSLAMQTESSFIKQTVMLELRSRFNHIYILQDYDKAGILGTFKLTRAYRFLKWFFIQDKKTKTNGLKDISDYIKGCGKEKTIELLKNKLNSWK